MMIQKEEKGSEQFQKQSSQSNIWKYCKTGNWFFVTESYRVNSEVFAGGDIGRVSFLHPVLLFRSFCCLSGVFAIAIHSSLFTLPVVEIKLSVLIGFDLLSPIQYFLFPSVVIKSAVVLNGLY